MAYVKQGLENGMILKAEHIHSIEDAIIRLDELVSDLTYEDIDINSMTVSPSNAEMGSVVNRITLSWSINRPPTELELDGEPISINLTTMVLTDLAITSNKSWTLRATDENGDTSSRTASINFLNGVYYGVAFNQSEYDSAFILSLTKNLRSNKLPSATVNAGKDQFIYYCLPVRFGTCAFTVGGFTGGFALVDTIKFTNASGYTEDYYIYRSDTSNLGPTAITII